MDRCKWSLMKSARERFGSWNGRTNHTPACVLKRRAKCVTVKSQILRWRWIRNIVNAHKIKLKGFGRHSRTFKSVCQGRLSRSRGIWVSQIFTKKFQEVDRDTWEANSKNVQNRKLAVLVSNSLIKKDVRNWAVWAKSRKWSHYHGVDFGGTKPHAINWYQIIKKNTIYTVKWDKSAKERKANKLFIGKGTRVCFLMRYMLQNLENNKLAEMVGKLTKEAGWRAKYHDFRVLRRFCRCCREGRTIDWRLFPPTPMPTNITSQEMLAHKDLQSSSLMKKSSQ